MESPRTHTYEAIALQQYSREELERRVLELSDFVENASLPLHWVDRNGIIVWANQAELDLLGYTAHEYIGYSIIDFHADRPVIEDILHRLTNKETLTNYPARLKCKDGSVKHVLINSNVFRKGDEFIHTRCFTRDVTLLKQSEERSARLAAIVASSTDAIIGKTLDRIVTSWNKSAELMFGYTESEVIGKMIDIIIPDNRMAEEQMLLDRIRKGEKAEGVETFRLTKNKTEIPVSLTISPIKGEDGLIIGASSIARDISKQKMYEDRLERYASHLEILNTIGQQIAEPMETDEILQKVIDVTVLATKAAFGAFFYHENMPKAGSSVRLKTSGPGKEKFDNFYNGHKSIFGTLINKEAFKRAFNRQEDIHTENPGLYALMQQQLALSGYLSIPVVSKQGAAVGMLLYGYEKSGSSVSDYENLLNNVAAQVSTALDKAALYGEIRLLNKKKDEFIGLASHELKTPVTSLQGYLQIVHKNLAVDDRNKDFIHRALKQANKLSRLIADLLDVSNIERGQLPLVFTDFDFTSFLSDLKDVLQYTTKTHRIELKTDIERLTVSADKNRLEQVITNLISNAVKYSPKADLISISAVTNSDRLIISVQDFGIGIRKDQQEFIFSRFYRVEELAGYMSGLGLGLYISREIIYRHGGSLSVESEFGKGSTFTFEIPVAQTL